MPLLFMSYLYLILLFHFMNSDPSMTIDAQFKLTFSWLKLNVKSIARNTIKGSTILFIGMLFKEWGLIVAIPLICFELFPRRSR